MAFRIHESIVRGEIDNRIKGIVRGRIWVVGRDRPGVVQPSKRARLRREHRLPTDPLSTGMAAHRRRRATTREVSADGLAHFLRRAMRKDRLES